MTYGHLERSKPGPWSQKTPPLRLRHVPEDPYARIQAQAAAHNRSVRADVIALLERAVEGPCALRPRSWTGFSADASSDPPRPPRRTARSYCARIAPDVWGAAMEPWPPSRGPVDHCQSAISAWRAGLEARGSRFGPSIISKMSVARIRQPHSLPRPRMLVAPGHSLPPGIAQRHPGSRVKHSGARRRALTRWEIAVGWYIIRR